MKRRILAAVLAVLIVLTAQLPAALAVIPGNTVYKISRRIADNLSYINTVSWDSTDGRGESFVLSYTRQGDAYPIVVKDETVYGSITIHDAVAYAQSLGKTVLAAFNSDFFSVQTGVPFGIFIEDGIYKSSPEGRNAVCIDNFGNVSITTAPNVTMTLNNHGGFNTENAGKSVSLTHFNKFRMDTGGMYLFSEDFSSESTRTATDGWFVRFRIIEGVPTVSGTMTLEVTETLVTNEAIEIGEGYLVLSAAHEGGYGEEFEKFAVGDIVTFTTTCDDPATLNAAYATGAGDMLVRNGARVDTSGWDALMQKRSPRTAIGLRADGSVVCYIIDGRDYTQSVGLYPDELVDEMLRQGCVTAINLDGGGSTAMSIRFPGSSAPSLVNKPSDGIERKCSTYILFVTDAVSNGLPDVLSLKNDGAVVLSGSTIALDFTASDNGFKPAPIPYDIIAQPTTYGSFISQTSSVDTSGSLETIVSYTAGEVSGTDMISLASPSTGASGKGNIVVITEPTSLTITLPDSTEKLTTVFLMPGETLELGLIATYYRRSVTAQAGSFEYAITGDIGEMTQPGVFTASYSPGATGTITVSAGETSAVLNVELGGFDDMIDHWAAEYVSHLAGTGVVRGISETEYGPELEIKRGDFVLMLYRAAGEPLFEAFDSFDDVHEDSYYADAIRWAKHLGIAAGMGDGTFGPETALTRQQAFTFVYRALGILNVSYADGLPEILYDFSDFESVADYAVIPAATLVTLGVVEGSYGMLTPEAVFTRTQMAKVLSVVLKLPTWDDNGTSPFEEIQAEDDELPLEELALGELPEEIAQPDTSSGEARFFEKKRGKKLYSLPLLDVQNLYNSAFHIRF